MRNYLTIAGKDSRDFGVYISGHGTFSAPEKAYTFYDVPGRNGAIIGNDHRLENIEVSYECFIYTNFNQNIAEFRTFLLSLDGYQKLTDSYHPDEYRLAVYVGPFEPDVTAKNDAGSFTLTFNCKPQRWLISGETTYSWVSGGAQDVSGYEIDMYAPLVNSNVLKWDYERHEFEYFKEWNGSGWDTIKKIAFASVVNVSINGATNYEADVSSFGITSGQVNLITGDISINSKVIALPTTGWTLYTDPYPIVTKFRLACADAESVYNCTDFLTAASGSKTYIVAIPGYLEVRTHDFLSVAQFETYLSNLDHDVLVDYELTSAETHSSAITPYTPNYPEEGFFTITDEVTNSSPYFKYATFTAAYTASDSMSNPTSFPSEPLVRVYGNGTFEMDGVTITVTNATSYTDIDCELMDCYEGTTNRNKDVSFSTYDFPKLQPGDNEIDIVSGITAVEITPRWWRV